MSKYLVETYYTCSFKILHRLDEINESELDKLDDRNDGKVEVIDLKLNSRKTKKINEKDSSQTIKKDFTEKTVAITNAVKEEIKKTEKTDNSTNVSLIENNIWEIYNKIV